MLLIFIQLLLKLLANTRMKILLLISTLALCQGSPAFIKHDYQQIIRDLSAIISGAQVSITAYNYHHAV